MLVISFLMLLMPGVLRADEIPKKSVLVAAYGLLMVENIDKKAAYFQRAIENGSINSDENNPIEPLVRQCLRKELDMLVEWISLDAASKIVYGEDAAKLARLEGNLKVMTSIQTSKDVLLGSSEELGANHNFAEMLRVFRKSLLQIKQYL